MLLSIAMFGGWLLRKDKRWSRQHTLFVVLLGLLALSVPMAANTFSAYMATFGMAVTILTVCVPMPSLLTSSRKIRAWVYTFVAVSLLVGGWALFHGGLGPSGSGGGQDENYVSAMMCMAIPFAYFSIFGETRRRVKLLLILSVVVFTGAVIVGFSRGGFVGLCAVGLYCLARSPKKLLGATVVAVIVIAALLFAGADYWEEMGTITDTSEATADLRLEIWKIGLRMWAGNPVFGVGPGNFRWQVGDYQSAEQLEKYGRNLQGSIIAHSLPVELLAELGTTGVIVVVALLVGTWRNVRRHPARDPTSPPGDGRQRPVAAQLLWRCGPRQHHRVPRDRGVPVPLVLFLPVAPDRSGQRDHAGVRRAGRPARPPRLVTDPFGPFRPSADIDGERCVKVEPQPPVRRFGVRKQILFTVIIVTAFLLLAEGAVRVYALLFRTSYERYNSQTGRLELVPNLRHTNARGEEFRINARGFVGPEFDQQPPAGVVRVMAVGDSCTFSEGFWRFAYPSILERQLNAAAGRKRFEVINAGIEGYNSTFARARIEQELIGYRPHLVLLYVGWNDLMKTDPRNAQAVGKYSALAALMEQSYLVRAYRKVMFVYLRPLLFRPRVGAETESRTYDAFVPAVYQDNLQSIVATLRRHGIQTVLVTRADRGAAGHDPGRPRQAARLLPVLRRYLQRGRVPGSAPRLQPGRAGRGRAVGYAGGRSRGGLRAARQEPALLGHDASQPQGALSGRRRAVQAIGARLRSER